MSAETFKQAEKLVQVDMTQAHLDEAAKNWRMQVAPLYGRRVGPLSVELEDGLRSRDTMESFSARVYARTFISQLFRSQRGPAAVTLIARRRS